MHIILVSLYILFSISLIKLESRTITITDITFNKYHELYIKYDKSLLCYCSNNSIPYKTFLSNYITIHPICSSIFIDQSWIKSIHLSNASRYGVTDFRTSAHSQVS